MCTCNDGGPAFPLPHSVVNANDPDFKLGHPGMSLRDWLAGQAIAGLAAMEARDEQVIRNAGLAYQIADAVLANRDRRL